MTAPDIAEIKRLVHALREPLGALAIRLSLLESEPQTPAAQHEIKAMRASIEQAVVAFEGIDFFVQNGRTRPSDLKR